MAMGVGVGVGVGVNVCAGVSGGARVGTAVGTGTPPGVGEGATEGADVGARVAAGGGSAVGERVAVTGGAGVMVGGGSIVGAGGAVSSAVGAGGGVAGGVGVISALAGGGVSVDPVGEGVSQAAIPAANRQATAIAARILRAFMTLSSKSVCLCRARTAGKSPDWKDGDAGAREEPEADTAIAADFLRPVHSPKQYYYIVYCVIIPQYGKRTYQGVRFPTRQDLHQSDNHTH